eukprot:5671918-Pleurochrysis_carterae.AAC.1
MHGRTERSRRGSCSICTVAAADELVSPNATIEARMEASAQAQAQMQTSDETSDAREGARHARARSAPTRSRPRASECDGGQACVADKQAHRGHRREANRQSLGSGRMD